MPKRAKAPTDNVRYEIYRLAGTAKFIGSVWAADEASAIEQAMMELGIDEAQRFKLIAKRAD